MGAGTGRRGGARAAFDELADCRKPIIAAIDGYCLAAGLEITINCDIRIATVQSRFGLPEARRSLIPGPGVQLSRQIPMGEALLILLTGGHVTRGADVSAWIPPAAGAGPRGAVQGSRRNR